MWARGRNESATSLAGSRLKSWPTPWTLEQKLVCVSMTPLGSQVLPGQLASLIYTSGTTGEPKGVMLTHTNFCSNVHGVGHDFSLDPANDVALSFLPLAYIYGRTLDYVYIFGGAPLASVASIDAVAQALP